MAVITKFGEPQERYVTREGTLAEDVVTGDYLIFSGSQLLRKTRQGDTVYSAYAGANLRAGTRVRIMANWVAAPVAVPTENAPNV